MVFLQQSQRYLSFTPFLTDLSLTWLDIFGMEMNFWRFWPRSGLRGVGKGSEFYSQCIVARIETNAFSYCSIVGVSCGEYDLSMKTISMYRCQMIQSLVFKMTFFLVRYQPTDVRIHHASLLDQSDTSSQVIYISPLHCVRISKFSFMPQYIFFHFFITSYPKYENWEVFLI